MKAQVQGEGKAPACTRAPENGAGANLFHGHKGQQAGTNDSMEKEFHTNHIFQTLRWSLKCFCFYVIFCAEGTVRVRGKVVNTADKLRAKHIIEWGGQLLAGMEVTVRQGSLAVRTPGPLTKEPVQRQPPEL